LPSDLVDKYDGLGGWYRAELDLATLSEIHEQIKDTQGDEKRKGNAAEARKQQRRHNKKMIDGNEMEQFLRDTGFIQDSKTE
jgi:hypothetical protein|tara:strand:- start:9053 stop:9298 length:246 start_codon:yes stop_codon:yes gene_type:complete